jgi:dihydropteroate synthase
MFTLNCKGRLLKLEKPVVMGVINITTDSYYSGSSNANVDTALSTAEKMLSEGARILDIGGQSTRPGAQNAGAEKELENVLPVIEAIAVKFPEAFISIDTYFSSVAKLAVAAGAHIVNDISGGSLDKDMLKTVGSLHVPYICMHIKGKPETMQQLAHYEDVTKEVLDFFIKKTEECRLAGINDIVVDPGFGFAKTTAQNFELLKNLKLFSILQKPLLIGLSRKNTIYKTLNTTPENALNGTTVLNTVALQNHVNILRVHDVKEAVEAIELMQNIISQTPSIPAL